MRAKMVMGHETEAWRKPSLLPGDTEIFSEPGRIVKRIANKTDYRSYWFVLVKPQFGPHALLVKRGNSEKRVDIAGDYQSVEALRNLSSDDRFFVLHKAYLLSLTGSPET